MAGYQVPGYTHLATARPQGGPGDLSAGRIDVRDLSPLLLQALERIGEMLHSTVLIFSGYRTSAYSQAVGGFAGDPHSRGIAVDAQVGGRPIGAVLSSAGYSALGLTSGNQPGFYKGGPDPSHVQLSSGDQLGKPATSTTATTGDFIDAVLHAIGAPITATNRMLLLAWTQAEGTKAKFNPLATTQPAVGASNFNSVGVKDYASFQSGVQATAATLKNGRYPGILSSLRAGNVSPNDIVNRYAREFDTWGTGAGAVSSRLHSLQAGGPLSQIAAGFNAVMGQVAKVDPFITNPLGAAGGSNPLSGFARIGDLIGNVLDPHWWLRVLELLAGGVLVMTGLYLLARQIGMPSVSGAIPQTRLAKAAAQ